MRANRTQLARLRVQIEDTWIGVNRRPARAITYIGSLVEFQAAGFITREHSERAKATEVTIRAREWPVGEFGDLHSVTPINEGPHAGEWLLRCVIGVNDPWLPFDESRYGFKGRVKEAAREAERFLRRIGQEEQRAWEQRT
jgi:hypothetical protein